MPLNVFIDTEFTDLLNPQLISLALVAESGEEFYAELPYDIRACSVFVRQVVLPLLDHDPVARMTEGELLRRLNDWLRLVKPRNDDVVICFDAAIDWALLNGALNGQLPTWCVPRLVDDRISELLRHDYHTKNGLPEHHALNDAKANCYAFRERILNPP